MHGSTDHSSHCTTFTGVWLHEHSRSCWDHLTYFTKQKENNLETIKTIFNITILAKIIVLEYIFHHINDIVHGIYLVCFNSVPA